MHLNPYGEYAVELAIDLLWNPPATGAELQNRCEEAGLTVDRPATDDDARLVADFLDRWLRVVDAPDDQSGRTN